MLLQGEVLVRLSLRPVNPADIFSIMGVYPGFTPASFPATPGLEGGAAPAGARHPALPDGPAASPNCGALLITASPAASGFPSPLWPVRSAPAA
jgi:hypothetical protein